MTARGSQGRTGEQGALDGELDGNPAKRRAIWSGHRLHDQYAPFLGLQAVWYAGFVVKPLYCCL